MSENIDSNPVPLQGLTHVEAAERLRVDGFNQLHDEPPLSRTHLVLNQFKSPVVITLLVATVLSGALGHRIDAAAIVAIVLINAVIGYAQEAKAAAAVAALKSLSVPRARVLREGQATEIPSMEVCRGDVLLLESGDFVPADARLLEAHQLTADEALLTGESQPSPKTADPVPPETPLAERSDMLFGGTVVTTGSARAVVIATGMHTEMGKIAGLLKTTTPSPTPLQRRLEEVSRVLLRSCLGVVILVVLLAYWHGESGAQVWMSGISLAVAAIPEGLPAVVTLALALAVRRMVKQKALVRHLLAVETLGSIDVICTDKTGTLTTGRMRVREVALPGSAIVAVEGLEGVNRPRYASLVRAAVLCSNASLGDEERTTGDPTEIALLYLSRMLFGSHLLAEMPPRVAEWSFDSLRKRMSVAVREENGVWLYCKGAPESVLALCTLSVPQKEVIEKQIHELSSKGRRLLVMARRPLKTQIVDSHAEAAAVEHTLEYLGLTALADPPRPESIGAIRACQAAGIRVVMITGDHPVTAWAIAAELGIVAASAGASTGLLTGADVEALSADALRWRAEEVSVYARVAPEHKLRIVNALKARGSVVAMTGDGVNDAPALKAADIGISMGLGGTEVARQASAMVLSDDNFATIVHAVKEGRAVYGNIRRTVQYLVSANLAEILLMLGAAIIGWPMPLFAIHLLWINLVTDGLPALALAAEPVPDGILELQATPSPKHLFDRHFYREMLATAVLLAGLALGVYGYGLQVGTTRVARSYLFSFLVFAELFRSLASRSETKTFIQMGAMSNGYHLAAVGIPMGFQLLLLHTSWFETLFDVQPVHWHEGLVLLAVTLIPMTILEIRKALRPPPRATSLSA